MIKNHINTWKIKITLGYHSYKFIIELLPKLDFFRVSLRKTNALLNTILIRGKKKKKAMLSKENVTIFKRQTLLKEEILANWVRFPVKYDPKGYLKQVFRKRKFKSQFWFDLALRYSIT